MDTIFEISRRKKRYENKESNCTDSNRSWSAFEGEETVSLYRPSGSFLNCEDTFVMNGKADPDRCRKITAYPLFKKFSTHRAPRVPVEKLSIYRTVFFSNGTGVLPLVTTTTGRESWRWTNSWTRSRIRSISFGIGHVSKKSFTSLSACCFFFLGLLTNKRNVRASKRENALRRKNLNVPSQIVIHLPFLTNIQ